MLSIRKKIFELRDERYRTFQSRLLPGISSQKIIGVRVPDLRRLTKELAGTADADIFLRELPHEFYDENMLHGLLISEEKEYRKCLALLEEFLPCVDNWAVCDILSPKVFKKHRKELAETAIAWSRCRDTYACRFGIGMLMTHFLDEDYRREYLEIPAAIEREEYYVRMMIAWYFATALAKRWEDAVVYLEDGRLEKWVHNKTIQKARESFRISDRQKEYLRSLKR